MNNKQCFPHEFGARNDPKLTHLQMEMGGQGLAIWWCLVEMLYENKGYLPDNPRLLAYQLRFCTADEVSRVVNEFDLFVRSEDGNIYNRSALKNVVTRQEYVDARVEAGRRGGVASNRQRSAGAKAGATPSATPCATPSAAASAEQVPNLNSIQYNTNQYNSVQENPGAGAPACEGEGLDLYLRFFKKDFKDPDKEVKRFHQYCADCEEKGEPVRDVWKLVEKWTPENKAGRFGDPAVIDWCLRMEEAIEGAAEPQEGVAFLRAIDGVSVDKRNNVLKIRMLTNEWGEVVLNTLLDRPDLFRPYEDVAVTKRNPKTL